MMMLQMFYKNQEKRKEKLLLILFQMNQTYLKEEAR